ncbi:MAG: FAD-dependent thymidylate synthase [Thermosulfidibacteraceae bacterium]|jgi:thymidylate synthase (FAD)
MYVKLIAHTPEPEELVFSAARLCYSSKSTDEILRESTYKSPKELIEKLFKIGHHSVFEHISFTFAIEGISRVTTHQLVRHRIASYSQRSQRYVQEDNTQFIIPDSIMKNDEALNLFKEVMDKSKEAYKRLLELGIPKEDARYLLPQCIETKIIVTMNARELLHFFRLRCCNRAQWEIRELATRMLREVKKVAPHVFRYAGPPCVISNCPEGEFTCGKMEEVRERFLSL